MTRLLPRQEDEDDVEPEELAGLKQEERDLARRIAEIEALPRQLRREAEERALTLPPPDDLADRKRRRDFESRAARGQIRNERRAQGRSLMLSILLTGAVIALVAWALEIARG